MRESPGVAKDREGTLVWDGAAETPLYTLQQTVLIPRDSMSFYLSYKSLRDDCTLTVFSSKDTPLESAALPATGQYTYRFLIPIRKSSEVWGFRIRSGAPKLPPEGSFSLAGAGIAPMAAGISIEGGEISTDGSVVLLAMSAGKLGFEISERAREKMAAGRWSIGVSLMPPVAGSASSSALTLSLSNASREKTYAVSADAGLGCVDVPGGSLGFVPINVSLSRVGGDASSNLPPSRGLTVIYIEGSLPIPADPGFVLSHPRSSWRGRDFEVFSWCRFPGVLIFDTADYDVQDRLFKRIAFFVEKPGYAGTIPDPAELADRHGWNAHDYRAEDLARFFDAAKRGGIPLTAGESELLKVLLSNSIVVENDAGYTAGDGAVISISQESGAELRRMLLIHESFHGVFFSLSEFRDACARAWKALSSADREMWLLYFALTGYDTSNDYLMVNEFQSYLFQQSRDELGALRAAMVGRVLSKHPEKESLARQFTTDSLRSSFDYLDQALQEAGGPPGGESIAVEAVQ